MTKLSLGGGYQKIAGFTNVDLCDAADVRHDLREPLPFEDKSVDEIMAIHVIESFNAWEFPAVLKDWARVLSGQITIEFTELSAAIKMYQSENEAEKILGHWGLYGNQQDPVDPIILHHYVYEVKELERLMKEAGFRDIRFTKENIAHSPMRDWRLIATA